MSSIEAIGISIGILVLIVLSAFFSGSETALFSLKPPLLRKWGREGTPGQKQAANLMTGHHETLVAILFGTNLVNILISVAVNRLAGGFGMGPAIAGLAATVILLIFGEVTPKTVAYGKAAAISERISPIIWLIRRTLHPAIVVLSGISKAFLNVLGPPPNVQPLSANEFQTFITLGENMSAFSEKEAELLREIFALRDNTISKAMIPRVDLCSVDVSWPPAKVESEIRRHRHRRLAVIDGSLDNLVGVLDVRRYFQSSPKKREAWVADIVSDPVFVPEHASLEKALNTLRSTRAGMVLVVDEYGGIAGLLTMEDLLEEVVGDLTDEYDVALWQSSRLAKNRWRFTGMVPLLEFQDEVGFKPPEDTVADTVSGLLSERLGNIPKNGDVVTVEQATFLVRSVVRKRVAEFDVELKSKQSQGDDTAGGDS